MANKLFSNQVNGVSVQCQRTPHASPPPANPTPTHTPFHPPPPHPLTVNSGLKQHIRGHLGISQQIRSVLVRGILTN